MICAVCSSYSSLLLQAMEYDELVYACALNRIFNYACDKARMVVSRFGSPSDIFRLNRRELTEIFGESSQFVNSILDISYLKMGEKDVEWAKGNNVRLFYIQDRDYPERLRECQDAPVILYFLGECDLNSRRLVSIVGSRNATEYGKKACREIVNSFAELDEPPVIVSGLAYGIDVTAHTAALDAGLRSIGVMATGLDTVYPSIHRKVASRMTSQGGIVSDFPIRTTPYPINFIRRNRIIAGLADATILIEAKRDGGGVVTAKMASSYDRDVFALPGRVDDQLSEGCNLLIRENCAEIITSRNSVRNSLGWKNLSKDRLMRTKFLIFESDNDIKKGVIRALYNKPQVTIDDLIDITGFGRGDLLVNLTELELEGRIKSDLIGRFMLLR